MLSISGSHPWDAHVVDLGAKRTDLLAQQEVIKFIWVIVIVGSLGHAFICGVWLWVQLHLLVGFLESFLSYGLVGGQLLAYLYGLVYVGTYVVWGTKFEKICVKRGHLGLEVVEELCLLHVGPLDFNQDFLEKLTDGKIFLVYLFLHEMSNHPLSLQGERLNCLRWKAIGVYGVEPVIRLLGVIDDHYWVFKLFWGVEKLCQCLDVEAETHAGVNVEADLVGVHQSLWLIFHYTH